MARTNGTVVSAGDAASGLVPYGGEVALPFDITTHEITLRRIRQEVVGFKGFSDGLLFNYIGADAGLSIIPVVGSLYTLAGSLWLLSQAFKIRASAGDKLWIVTLGAMDAAVGALGVASGGITVVIDAVLRVHAWSADRLTQHMDIQLAAIDHVRAQLADAGQHRPRDEHPVLEQLRDLIFRGGKTKQEMWVRVGLIVAACVALLGYCEYRDSIRRQQVADCKARGEWFCEWKY